MLTLRHSLSFLLICSLLPVYIWLQATGKIQTYQSEALPPGQIYYVLSKLFGLIAVVFLWLQICLGLLRSSGLSTKKISLNLHQMLGLITASAILIHFLLFFIAVWLRKEAVPMGLLMPKSSDYYHIGLSFGQLALILTMLVIAAGRKNIKRLTSKLWWWLHRLSFAVFVFAVIHSYMIGSETRWSIMPYVYLFMLGSVSVLLIRRLYVR